MSNTNYNNFNIDDDDDDIFIQPDIPQKKKSVPAANTSSFTQQQPSSSTSTSQPAAAASSSANEGTGFFNFANFVNPTQYFNPNMENSNIQVKERQFSGGNTLDESVLTTLHRDVAKIGDKLLSILWPMRLRQKLIVVERISTRFTGATSNVWGMEQIIQKIQSRRF
ncbi:unnamed protein product [Ambrosiozyma monospora]|uniref:Unnamed protein product n=1 Tax=Ambrosiozyma monospora TaxID=43982 RepID=A0ACB5UB97_AMBMO|nr:unnamed protein product [Ambrosiozyma monospora]